MSIEVLIKMPTSDELKILQSFCALYDIKISSNFTKRSKSLFYSEITNTVYSIAGNNPFRNLDFKSKKRLRCGVNTFNYHDDRLVAYFVKDIFDWIEFVSEQRVKI